MQGWHYCAPDTRKEFYPSSAPCFPSSGEDTFGTQRGQFRRVLAKSAWYATATVSLVDRQENFQEKAALGSLASVGHKQAMAVLGGWLETVKLKYILRVYVYAYSMDLCSAGSRE